MKNLWEKYLQWSDKINAPFHKHKDRLVLYVVLAQTVIVTVGLLNLSRSDGKMVLHCSMVNYSDSVCVEVNGIVYKE